MTDNKIYLAVPFKEKNKAKKLGCSWDMETKKWFIYSHQNSNAFDAWKTTKQDIKELKGENREYGGQGLYIDMIPSTCSFKNVRSSVSECEWDRLRRYVYERVENKCECCGSQRRIEAHERFEYDEKEKTQTLKRLIALCHKCHEVCHIGHASHKGRYEIVKKHLKRVCKFNDKDLEEHIRQGFATYVERSKIEWKLNLDLLEKNGIELKK